MVCGLSITDSSFYENWGRFTLGIVEFRIAHLGSIFCSLRLNFFLEPHGYELDEGNVFKNQEMRSKTKMGISLTEVSVSSLVRKKREPERRAVASCRASGVFRF